MAHTLTFTTDGTVMVNGVEITSPYTLQNGDVITVESGRNQTINGTNYDIIEYDSSTISITDSDITISSYGTPNIGFSGIITINYTETVSRKSIDLTTLSGWESLSAGDHTITIVAKADGYRDSEPSAEVNVEKAAQEASNYQISVTPINCSEADGNPTIIYDNQTATLRFWGLDMYMFYDVGFEVTGADFSWSLVNEHMPQLCEIILSNPTGPVNITVTAYLTDDIDNLPQLILNDEDIESVTIYDEYNIKDASEIIQREYQKAIEDFIDFEESANALWYIDIENDKSIDIVVTNIDDPELIIRNKVNDIWTELSFIDNEDGTYTILGVNTGCLAIFV